MEKIYMNENGSSKKKKINKLHISIIMSFVIAIFAMLGLIAVGFNRVSYAAPASTTSSFTLAKYGTRKESSSSTILPKIITSYSEGSQTCSGGVKGFFYEAMYISRGTDVSSIDPGQEIDSFSSITPVFCIGLRSKNAGFGSTYNKNSVVNDSGIAYILSKSNIYNSSSHIVPLSVGGTNNRQLEAYATQLAIWIYLKDPQVVIDGDVNKVISDVAGVNGGNVLYNFDTPEDDNCAGGTQIYKGNLYTNYIKPVVDGAIAANNTGVTKSIYVSLDTTVSEVEGTDLIQTSEIKVTGNPSNDLEYYSMSISGIDGAYVVDKDGKKVETLTNLSPTSKYYVRFNKSNVTEEKKTLTVSVSGTFKDFVPYKYMVSTDIQEVVYYDDSEKVVSNSTSIDVVGSPDTGMSTSQTIYFIGLIVLLCGVGIIYANSKPLKGI